MMFHRCYKIILSALCCLLSVSCIRDDSPSGKVGVIPGNHLPDFSVELNNGSILSSAQLEGKVSVIVFFHTECSDCQKELPVVQKLYDTYLNDNNVCVYCISREEDELSVASYWSAHQFTVPYSPQSDRTVYSLFSEQGIPRIYISDACRIVRSVYSDNPLPSYEELVEDVECCRNSY